MARADRNRTSWGLRNAWAANVWATFAAAALTAAGLAIPSAPARGEGHGQIGLAQRMQETNVFFVDVKSANEWINISACGEADSHNLRFVVSRVPSSHDVFDGPPATATQVKAFSQSSDSTTAEGKVSCSSNMTAPPTDPWRYQEGGSDPYPRLYQIEIDNQKGTNKLLKRVDITVTPDKTTAPDPTGQTGITGRVFSYKWSYSTGTFGASAAATSAYYMRVPGGIGGSNYVWKMSFDNLSGHGYGIIANNVGVSDPANPGKPSRYSGYTTPAPGQDRFGPKATLAAAFDAVPLYPVYINFPELAANPPTSGPLISGFRFVDSAGQDYSISPGNGGVQDTGEFRFNVTNTVPGKATYQISIDTNQNGTYGDSGDVRILGVSKGTSGTDVVPWDGTDPAGQILPDGNYGVQLQVRLGEFHFVANDLETVGGPSGQGLTIQWARKGQPLANTAVYWDDKTIFDLKDSNGVWVYWDRGPKGKNKNGPKVRAGYPRSANSTLPNGVVGAYHRWGDLSSNKEFGDEMYVDTYVFGNSAIATYQAVIDTTSDASVYKNAEVEITPDPFDPGNAVTLKVTDNDVSANLDAVAVDTVSVTVTNPSTSDSEAVTLTETGANTGVFTATLNTAAGTSGTANDTVLTARPGDTVTLTYAEPADSANTGATRTDTAKARPATTGVLILSPSAVQPGQAVSVSLADADRNTNPAVAESITVTVSNSSGQSYTLTLTETGVNTGVFAAPAPTAQTGFAVTGGDTVTVTYADPSDATGAPLNVSKSLPVGGVDGTVEIFPAGTSGATNTTKGGEKLSLRIKDADLAGNGTVSVTVSVKDGANAATGETLTLTLTETGPTTGVFEALGGVTTAANPVRDNGNSTLELALNDTVSVTYVDALDAAAGSQTRTDAVTVAAGNTGVVEIDPDPSRPGQALTLKLTDADLSTTATVTVTGPSGDSEAVTLTETGAGTGVFTATLNTAYGTSVGAGEANDATLKTAAGHTLTVTYADAYTAAGVTGAATDMADVVGGTLATIAWSPGSVTPGKSATLTVFDPDLKTATSITVTVVNARTGESETLTLTPTGASDGTFTRAVATSVGTGPDPAAGTLRVQPGDTLTASFTDPSDADGATQTVTAGLGVVGGHDGVVTLTPDPFHPGDSLSVSLTDADLAGTTDPVTVALTGPGGDSETVTLTETGPSTGVFTGTVATAYGTSGTAGDGTMAAKATDTLTATYADALKADTTSGTATDTASAIGGVTAILTGSPDPLVPGGTITLTVTDADRKGDGSLTVTVRNPSTGETETVTLAETGASTGVFTATLATTPGTVANPAAGALAVADGVVLQLETLDPRTAEGASRAINATLTVSTGAAPVITLNPDPSRPGDTLTVRVVHAAADTDAGAAETVTATVTDPATGDAVTATLLETGPNTGVFTATLATAYGATGTTGDPVLTTKANDTLTASYTNGVTVTDTAQVVGGTPATVGLAPDPSHPGQSLTLRVTDADRAGEGSVSAVLTKTGTNAGGDTETVVLLETGPSTGVFEAVLATAYGASGTPGDKVMATVDGDTLTLTYQEPRDAAGGPATLTDAAAVAGGVDGVLALSPFPVTPGDPLTVTLTDPDQNADPIVAETVTVTVRDPATGDVETLVLAETGPDTGVFTANLATAPGPITAGDATLAVTPGGTVTASYSDPLPKPGTTGPTTASVSVAAPSAPPVAAPVAGTVTAGPAPLHAGSPISLTVTDADLKGTGTLGVDVRNPRTGETETVTLTETAPGVFTGTLASANLPGAAAAVGTLGLTVGDTISVTYLDAANPSGAAATRTASLAVANRPPVAVNDSGATGPGKAVSFPVLVNDGDPDGHDVSVLSATQGQNGAVTFTPDGQIVYTPRPGFAGTDSFTYTIGDGRGGTDTAIVSVTVDAAAPTANADSVGTDPGVAVTIPVLVNDSDPNDETLTVTVIQPGANGTVTVGPNDALVYTPNPGFTGTDTFTYRIENPQGGSDTAIVTVTVDPYLVVARDDAATTPAGTPVAIDVTGNDEEPKDLPLTVVSVTQPLHGKVVIGPDGKPVYTSDGTHVGRDSFTYTACNPADVCDIATVTVDVTPPLAALEGVVWQDDDHDGVRDPNEPLLTGWTVELVAPDGRVIGTAVTGADGAYAIADMPVGTDYEVRFRHPETNVVWGVLTDVALAPGVTALDQNLAIDPSGVVYDALTRAPIPGAVLTMRGANGAILPEACFLDPSQARQVTGADGRYRFDIVPGGAPACPAAETVYTIALAGPGGFLEGPSELLPPRPGPFDPTGLSGPVRVGTTILAPRDGGPGDAATAHYYTFRLAPGDPDVVDNHLALDPVGSRVPLQVVKRAQIRTATVGALVPYTITVTHPLGLARSALSIVDLAPPGFRYVAGSGRVNGRSAEPVRGGAGRAERLVWVGVDLAASRELRVDLVLLAGSGVGEGVHKNLAHVESGPDGARRRISNVAEASVSVRPDGVFDCAAVIGKVFDDRNANGHQDAGERGLPAARVASVTGLVVTTDAHGRFHIPCASVPDRLIGSNFILKLDERSLPLGYEATSENPRVIRLTRGKAGRINFGAKGLRPVTLDLMANAFEAHSATLRPRWAEGVDRLVAVLTQEPSSLSLVYRGADEDGLALARIAAAQRLIEAAWRRARGRASLPIQRQIVSEARP